MHFIFHLYRLLLLWTIFLLFSSCFLHILLLILSWPHPSLCLLPLSFSALIFSPSSFLVSSFPTSTPHFSYPSLSPITLHYPLHLFWPLERPGRAEEITPILHEQSPPWVNGPVQTWHSTASQTFWKRETDQKGKRC